jgi:acyl-CoA synthetase (NDP forming)
VIVSGRAFQRHRQLAGLLAPRLRDAARLYDGAAVQHAMSRLEFLQRLAALVEQLQLHPPMTASRLSISAVGCPIRVGNACSTDRTADVRRALEADQRRKTVSVCFRD